MKYVNPEPFKRSFTCPFCDTTSAHSWAFIESAPVYPDCGFGYEYVSSFDDDWYKFEEQWDDPCKRLMNSTLKEWGIAECSHCRRLSIWHKTEMVYPRMRVTLPANEGMPANVREVYQEAALVFYDSPRSAAALLRLALQMLLEAILKDESTGSIYKDMNKLVEKGASSQVVKAMDIIRYNGNESVHPGAIDLSQSRDDAMELFALLNIISEAFITGPARIDEMYQSIPESKRVKLGQ